MSVLIVAAVVAGVMSARPSPTAAQQQQRPAFQAAVEALLDAIAEPTPDRVRQLGDTYMSPAYRDAQPLAWHVARLTEMRAALGRAELRNLVFEVPGERRATVQSGVDGQTYILTFRVTSDTPPKIAGMTLERGLSGTLPASSGPVTPESRARSFLDVAFNATPDAAERWLREAYAPGLLNQSGLAQHLNFLGQIRDEMRDIEIVRVTSSSATEATAVYRSLLTDEWRELAVQVESQAPNRLTNVARRLIPAPAPHAAAPLTLSPDERRAALDAYAKRLADADMFSGTVLVARGGEVIFEGGYGAASREFGVPNTPETRIGIGSINKMFTTVGILQLVEQGKLSLQDPMSRHLAGVLPAEAAAKIRIEHLLTHTSGLGDFLFTPKMMDSSRPNYRTIADYLPLLANTTLAFEPGTRWSYSNAGFLVLGAILERVSGVPYDDYIQRNVFERAGMTHSGPVEVDLVPTGLATAYQREFDGGRPRLRSDRYHRPVRTTPAGGGYSTARDLFRFITALRGNHLLSPAMTALMLSSKPELNSPNYGYGTQIFSSDGRRFGHTGGGMGTSASVEYDASSDLVIVGLGNMNTGAAAVRARARLLYGTVPPTP